MRSKDTVWLGWVSALAAAVAACNGGGGSEPSPGGSSGGGGSGGSVAAVQECDAMAQAYCAVAPRCGWSAISVVFADEATCRSHYAQACAKALTQPGTSFTAARAEACASATQAQTCAALMDDALLPAECRWPPGSLADGSPCVDGSQCQSGSCPRTMGALPVWCGRCGKPLSKAGEKCSPQQRCEVELECANLAYPSMEGTCVSPGGVGAACDDKRPCQDLLVCASGQCSYGGGAGAPCDGKKREGCDTLHNVGCNPGTNRCEAVAVLEPGQPCTVSKDAPFPICRGATCSALVTPGGGPGTCAPNPKPGDSCQGNASCGMDLWCVDGVCSFPDTSQCAGGGTDAGADSGAIGPSCAALAACCEKMSPDGGARAGCDQIAKSGLETSCSQILGSWQKDGGPCK